MYEKCATCEKIGMSCRGPKFVSMPANDLIALCIARKKHLGLSNQQIADRAHMSKGTVDNLLAATHGDFRYGTIQPVLDVLFSGEVSGNPCPDPSNDERVQYEERIRQLEKEIAWREDKIATLNKQTESMQTLISNTNARTTQDKDFLRSQIKSKNKTIIALASLLAVSLSVIIAALIIDRLNSDMGFFWLESLFKPHGITETLLQWRT